ncbi:MAG: hypothetical protein K1X68_13370 [Saprospiraceae bacterium]|nr:hypothetical protein [Saprospiraceae bacterium]HMW39135.1 hypothetical protein [Saprospiraceae bacterium]HMX89064.1 hypothetical protein [Saprospiraceae bacterium]HMZ40663.1 hypothetical protein [Saprospiraceae bacterium]HNA63924.1 hypothetical protein [Saprospiraceae bacterium]
MVNILRNVFRNFHLLVFDFLLTAMLAILLKYYWTCMITKDVAHQYIFDDLVSSYQQPMLWDLWNYKLRHFKILNPNILGITIFALLVYGWIHVGLIWLTGQKTRVSLRHFIVESTRYYPKTLLNTIIFLSLALLWVGFIVYLMMAIVVKKIEQVPSEKPLVWLAVAMLVIIMAGLMLIAGASIHSKKRIILGKERFLSSIMPSVRRILPGGISDAPAWMVFIGLSFGATLLYSSFSEEGFMNGNGSARWILQQGLLLFLFVAKFVWLTMIGNWKESIPRSPSNLNL